MTSGRVYFDLPKPVVAAVGFDQSEAAAFEGLVGKLLAADSFLALARPWDEIDIAVVKGPITGNIPTDIPVLYRGSGKTVSTDYVYPGAGGGILDEEYTDAVKVVPEVTETQGLNEQIEDMVRRFPERGRRRFRPGPCGTWERPFVTNLRNEILSGEYRRNDEALGWILPSHEPISATWLRLFLERIHEDDPERVPQPPPRWEPWDTARVELLKARREERYDEFSSKLREFQDELASMGEEIEEEVRRANEEGLGLLLTADGEELKGAVATALSILDLQVTDVDGSLDPGDGKREDLWVDHEDERVIIEVKGYTKGAKVSDLMRAKDYRLLHLQRQGFAPNRQWHVVNAFRTKEPDARQRLFEGHDDAVKGFGGLIIDSRDLFRLVRAVERGELEDATARNLLWNAPEGLFRYPSESE